MSGQPGAISGAESPPPLARLVMRGPVLATDVLHCFPIFECGFDCQKISGLAVVGVLLDGSASPRELTTAWVEVANAVSFPISGPLAVLVLRKLVGVAGFELR